MKNRVLLTLSIGLFVTSGPAFAAFIKGTYPGCLSKEYLSAAASTDSLKQLMASGKCTIVQKGQEFVMLDSGFLTSKILYKGFTLYVPSEAVR